MVEPESPLRCSMPIMGGHAVTGQALHSLLAVAVQRHQLVCAPLERLHRLMQRLVLIEGEAIAMGIRL